MKHNTRLYKRESPYLEAKMMNLKRESSENQNVLAKKGAWITLVHLQNSTLRKQCDVNMAYKAWQAKKIRVLPRG